MKLVKALLQRTAKKGKQMKYLIALLIFAIGFFTGGITENYSNPRVITKTEVQWVTPSNQTLQDLCHGVFDEENSVSRAYNEGYKAGLAK